MSFWIFLSCELLFFLIFLFLSKKGKLCDEALDLSRKSQKACFAGATLFFMLFAVVWFFGVYKPALTYPFDQETLAYRNAYEQQFDAFLKHRLSLDIQPSQELLALENPYDPQNRENVSFLWDRAFFGGKYYSYFGVAPIFTVYYPFYFLTGKVPSASIVCFILAEITVPAISVMFLKATRLFCGKANFILTLFGLCAAETGSLVFMLLVSADMYYIAVLSGVCNLVLFFLFTFSAILKKKALPKCVEFFFSGLFLALAVMSRPNMALTAIAALPLFFHILFAREINIKNRLLPLFSFAVPLFFGAAFQMWYNFARFGSVLDFGSAYQLTVADVSTYQITPALLLPAVYHYFLQLPYFESEFPYFHLSFDSYRGGYTGYLYMTRTMGVFSLPASLGLLVSPMSFFTKGEKAYKKACFALSGLSVLAVAFLDMCLGGVNIRYLTDIAAVSVLFGALSLIYLYSTFDSDKPKIRYLVHSAISLILVWSAFVGAFLVFENERFSNFG